MSVDESMLFVGLDIGGTNVKAGLLDGETGELLVGVKEELLPKHRGDRTPEAVVDRLVALAQSLLDDQGISWEHTLYVGVGCPGQIERETGVVVGASSFPGWSNVPLASLVQARTGRPVTVLNDASAAASAEFTGRGSQETIAVLTLGTGIGLGVVCAGRVVTGSRGLVEGGHMIVEPGAKGRLCGCGQRGCLEAYASAPAVATIASERLSSLASSNAFPAAAPPSSSAAEAPPASVENGGVEAEAAAPESPRLPLAAPATPTSSTSPGLSKPKSMNRSDSAVSVRIMELERRTSASAPGSPSTPRVRPGSAGRCWSGGDGDGGAVGVDITAADVFAMAKQGDEVAIQVVEDTCDYLGLACVNICRVLDPDAILLTGGLSKAEGLVDKVRQSFSARGWKVLPHECEISLASTCVAAGVIGAAGAAACEYALARRRNRKRSHEGGSGSGSHAGTASAASAAVASGSGSRGLRGWKRGAGGWKSFFVGVGVGVAVAGAAAAAAAVASASSRGVRIGSR